MGRGREKWERKEGGRRVGRGREGWGEVGEWGEGGKSGEREGI